MADKDRPQSPEESFSELVTQWERNYNEFANQLMGTEGFSQAMNQAQNAQLAYQKSFAQSMSQTLAAMNIPSREDVLHILDAVAALDRRMERIEAKLEIKQTPKRTKKRPPRTKKPDVDESSS